MRRSWAVAALIACAALPSAHCAGLRADGNEVLAGEVAEARNLFEQGADLAAARIVSRCLVMERGVADEALQDCLALGERVGVSLGEESMYELRPAEELPAVEAALGVAFHEEKYAGPSYGHEYFERLRQLFPDSKYRDLFTYVLIDFNVMSRPWREVEIDLLNYLREFPDGRYAMRATLDLAHFYDDMWQAWTFEWLEWYEWKSIEPSPHQRARAAKFSAKYKTWALERFDLVIAAPGSRRLGISASEYDETIARRTELANDVPDHSVYTWSD